MHSRTIIELNPEQQAAVDSDASRRLVLATAGSGKSRTLVAAVAREAQEHVAGGIVVISYTNNACAVLQERLAALGVIGLGACSTLHAFLFRMLREWTQQSLSVIDDDAKAALVEQVAEDLGVKLPVKKLLEHLDKDGLVTLRDGKVSMLDCVGLEYEARLISSGLVDFNTILVKGAEACHRLHEAGRWPYTSIWIDELQDSAKSDFDFYLNAPFEKRFACGDPDQSLYAFRGARPDILVKLANNPEWQIHKLEFNYRSGAVICRAASELIEHNKNRVPKRMLAEHGSGIVTVHRCEAPADELSFVLEKVKAYTRQICHCGDYCDMHNTGSGHAPVPMEQEGDCGYEGIAILARTNHAARTFADHLKANGVPVATVEQPQRPPDWKEAKLLLTVLANPFCDQAVLALIRATECPQDAKLLRESAAMRMISVNELLGYRFGNTSLPNMERLPPCLSAHGISSESRELVHNAARELSNRGEWGISDLVVYLGEQENAARTIGAGVRITTVHQAKGTEAECVFVVGCEEQGFPSAKDCATTEGLEESRRLAFTAITRAKSSLTLTWCANRPQFRGDSIPAGPMEKRTPSRFILEMGLKP